MTRRSLLVSAALLLAIVAGAGATTAVAATATDSVAASSDALEEIAEPAPKEAAPQLEKYVQEDSSGEWGKVADAEAGQILSFKLDLTLPDRRSEQDQASCRIVDTTDENLIIDPDSVSIALGSLDITDAFTVCYEDSVLELEAADLSALDTSETHLITIIYEAQLSISSDAAMGARNSAYLEYESDDGVLTTPETTAAVMSYRLAARKVDAADYSHVLSGATFVLKRSDSKFAVLEDDCISEWTTDQAEATPLTTDKYGLIHITGLDTDEYALIEIEAPSGYTCAADEIWFSLHADTTFDLATQQGKLNSLELVRGSSNSAGDADSGSVYAVIENEKLTTQNATSPAAMAGTMPKTGDQTTSALPSSVFGAALVGAALVVRNRMNGGSKHEN